MFSGVFAQGVVKVASSQLIQLKQFSSAYQAKTALMMSDKILKNYIEDNDDDMPETGKVKTSVGEVHIVKISENEYRSSILLSNGITYSSDTWIEILEVEEEPEEELDEDLEEDVVDETDEPETNETENAESDPDTDAESDPDDNETAAEEPAESDNSEIENQDFDDSEMEADNGDNLGADVSSSENE